MTPSPPSKKALSGLKVLDLSRILAGPWATQILGDLGADVVKIESPIMGDDTRSWGPPFTTKPTGQRSDAAYFACCNRNKRSVTIDFSKPDGAELVRRMAEKADIFVENFKVGGLAKYGLDYAAIREVNPSIIYCSVTGFGQTGPYAHRPGYDFLIQGMGGLMSITGQPDGASGAEPMKVGVAVCDLFTGMNAVTAILAAVTYRQRTGIGQHIDCSLLDSQVAMLANQASNWLNGEVSPQRMGNNHPNVVPYRVFATADGYVIISCGNDRQFGRLCMALGAQELATDPHYATNEARIANRVAIDTKLGERLIELSQFEVIDRLEKANVPCGPINTIPDVFSDPHVNARDMVVTMSRPDGTRLQTAAFPVKLSETPASYDIAPPELGADTAAALADWIKLDQTELDRYQKLGIV